MTTPPRTCECGSTLFHGPFDYIHQDGSKWLYCTCAECGHIVLLGKAGE